MRKESKIKSQKLNKNYFKLKVTPPNLPLKRGGTTSVTTTNSPLERERIAPVVISAIVIVNPRWGQDIELLPGCLDTLGFVDEIILVASEVSNKLKVIGAKYKTGIIKQRGVGFADWRNLGAEEARGAWLLYVDCDERVTPQLSEEIQTQIAEEFKIQNSKFKSNSNQVERAEQVDDTAPAAITPSSSPIARGRITPGESREYAGYAIPRLNRILGKEFRHGGWWPDYVLRLMRKDKFLGYEGDLHEQPKLEGNIGYLENYFVHIKHQSLEDYVGKTINWSDKEADLLMKAGHPRLSAWRFWRLTAHPFLTSFLNRYVLKRGFLDGTEGLIDAVYQSYSQFMTFAKLWEKQQSNTSIDQMNK